MNAFARLILSAGLLAGMAVPTMAQTTSHGIKRPVHVTHHIAKAAPAAAMTPVTAAIPAVAAPVKPATITAAPAPVVPSAAKPPVPAKN